MNVTESLSKVINRLLYLLAMFMRALNVQLEANCNENRGEHTSDLPLASARGGLARTARHSRIFPSNHHHELDGLQRDWVSLRTYSFITLFFTMDTYTQNVQPVSPVASASISSPRMMLPRSHRSHRSRRSPRQESSQDRELEIGQQARAASNLKTPDPNNTLNIDPDEPYLEPASADTIRDLEAQQARQAADGPEHTNFVGGFSFDRFKKAVHGASIQWGSGSRRAQGLSPAYSPPYRISTIGEPPNHQRYSSSDDTMHYPAATTEEGTTAIDHNMPEPRYAAPASMITSPVHVEPLPTDDYRKMRTPSPTPPDTSYFARLKTFLRDLNSLPWVSEDRVTVDYYPGQSRRRARPTSGRSQNRSAISMSWYGENHRPPTTLPNTQQIDLTAGESPEMKRVDKPEPTPDAVGQVYYTQSGQVWPAVSTVPEPQIPVSPMYDFHDSGTPAAAPPMPIPQPAQSYSPPMFPQETYYTSDAGQSWPVASTGYDNDESSPRPADPNGMAPPTFPQETYYTNDAGQSWPVVSSGYSEPPRTMDPQEPNFYGTHYGPSSHA